MMENNNNVVIGWAPASVIEVKTEDYVKYRFGKENLLWLPKDGPEIFRGDALLIAEKRNNGLAGDVGWFEAIRRPSFDKESNRFAVKIQYVGSDRLPENVSKMSRIMSANKKGDMLSTDC